MYHLFLIVLGLTLFFLGLNLFKKFALNQAESRLNNLIEKTIKNNLNAFFVGIIATFVVQSSSSIISITICLVSCNLLKYKHALAIVLGSNIGTCFNSFIYALNVFDYSYIIVIIGLLMALFNIKNYQYFLDIGFVFYGLFLIENGMDFFASSESFRRVLFSSNNPFYAFLISGILSGIIQSSSVIIVLTQNLLSNLIITPSIAISICLGSNIGTCITGLIAAISNSKLSKKVAYFNFYFNLVWGLLFLLLLNPYTNLVLGIYNILSLNNTKFILSIAHLLFNTICSVICLILISLPEKENKLNIINLLDNN